MWKEDYKMAGKFLQGFFSPQNAQDLLEEKER